MLRDSLAMLILANLAGVRAQRPPAGMVVGSVSEPLESPKFGTYLIFLPPTSTENSTHPVLLFLHGVGGINNGKGCRNPGLTTQFPLLDPAYAAKVDHIVLVPVAKQPNWRHHFTLNMALVDMAISELGGEPSRVAIAGQSMGGHGAYLYASELAPGRFCAVVAACGYLDEEAAVVDAVPSAVLEPLKSTPLWIFHSEVDDEVPPPGRPQDDSNTVVKAFRAAGNTAVKHTRYPKGTKGAHYIPGHAAFELAFHEDELWEWLEMQKRPPPAESMLPLALGVLGALVILVTMRLARFKRLAWAVSTLSLVASSVAYLFLQQSEGGMLDSCYSFSFFDVTFDQCREIGAGIARGGPAAQGYLALFISKGRAENCFALGMGLGALYSLVFLAKGTREVAVVHLMHSGWALSVCLVNAQNAGLLPAPAEANIHPSASAKLVPFVVITGVQACLGVSAFILSGGQGMAKEKKA